MRLFTLFAYLKTKESHDRWATSRVWGFRHQISKAKYLKMSVGNIRKLQENTAALYTERKTLRVSAIRRSGHVCLGKLKHPPLLSGCETSGCEISDQRIWTCLTGQNSGSEISGRRKGDCLCVQGVGTPPPDDTKRALLSGATPSGFPKRTRAAMLSGATPSGFPQEDMRRHAIRICLWKKTSKLRFFMFLSFPLLYQGFQRTLLNHGVLW